MSVIKSILIKNVESGIKHKYIRNILKNQQIASVGKIIIVPSHNGYANVLIDIKKWHDTEIAYNFIKRIRNPLKEAKLIHCEDNWWSVRVHNRKSVYKKY